MNKEKLLEFLKKDYQKVLKLEVAETDIQYWQGVKDWSVEIINAIEDGEFD